MNLIKKNSANKNHLFPFLIGEELLGNYNSQPKRMSIDFSDADNIYELQNYSDLNKHLTEKVLPKIEEKANKEFETIKKKGPRQNHLDRWWQMWCKRDTMLSEVSKLTRYIACARVTKRNIFEFISSEIRPNDKIIVFAFEDNYSFGILHSNIHWSWFKEKATTLEERLNYNTIIFDTFPWPQTPTEAQIKKVALAAKTLREERTKTMQQHKMSLRDLYRLLEQPGKNPIKDLHAALDKAVLEAYGFNTKEKTISTDFILENLLALNHEVAAKEKRKEEVQAPGLPEWIKNKEAYVSEDCVRFEW